MVGVGGMPFLDTRTPPLTTQTQTSLLRSLSTEPSPAFPLCIAESGVCAYAASAVPETTDGVLRLQVRVEFDMHAFSHTASHSYHVPMTAVLQKSRLTTHASIPGTSTSHSDTARSL